MGEWSEFYEDYPEHNAANWDGGNYLGPNGSKIISGRLYADEELRKKVAKESREMREEINAIIEKHRPKKRRAKKNN